MALLQLLQACLAMLVLCCGTTWLVTTIQFNRAVESAHRARDKAACRTPTLPYLIPILGSTISFSSQKVGTFWRYLLSLARDNSLSAISIILNGAKVHFIFSPHAVQDLFKARGLTRFRLDQELGKNVLGMTKEEAVKAFPADLDAKEALTTERIHSELLLSTSGVNTLMKKFMEVLTEQLLGVDAPDVDQTIEVDLYQWLRDQLFRASTTALCGSRLLEIVPDLSHDFWVWDEGLLPMLFGTPRLFAKDAYAARDKLVAGLKRWLISGYSAGALDSDVDWEPNFGTRVVRRRHEFYAQQKLDLSTQAGFDLIFLSGILQNSIPAAGWMLMHLFGPERREERLLEDVMAELVTSQKDDGSIDINKLTGLPLLNSMFHEVLRLYIDLLVTRQVDTNSVLDKWQVNSGDMVMAPTWMVHRNPEYYSDADVFNPRRFLTIDPATGSTICSTSGYAGKYFPFGGGHYMCPGRNVAKQEVLATVAMLLLNFDVEFLGWRDKLGFPRLKKGFAGNVVVGLEGDMKVKLTRRRMPT